jgi:hypothetical protein
MDLEDYSPKEIMDYMIKYYGKDSIEEYLDGYDPWVYS